MSHLLENGLDSIDMALPFCGEQNAQRSEKRNVTATLSKGSIFPFK
jgi:hypothetical protein